MILVSACDDLMAHGLRCSWSFIQQNSLKGGEEMKKFAIALAIVLGLVGSIVSLSAPVSYAQEEPAPKPDKPGD
jgi:hypothetical protein